MGFGQVVFCFFQCLGNVLIWSLVLAQLSAVRLLLLSLYVQCHLKCTAEFYRNVSQKHLSCHQSIKINPGRRYKMPPAAKNIFKKSFKIHKQFLGVFVLSVLLSWVVCVRML